MNNPRLFLWVALALILFVNYQTWMKDYGAEPVAAQATTAGQRAATELGATAPQAAPAATGSGAPAATPGTTTAAAATAPTAATVPADVASEAGSITVHTDVLDLSIGLRGGELDRADILQYPKVKNQPGVPVRLFRREGADALYVMQSGLAGDAGAGARPTHLAVFSSSFTAFSLLDGVDELRVPLTWASDDGVTVMKTFVFHRGSYRVDLEYSVNNAGSAPWAAASYAQILHDMPPVERSYLNVETYSSEGPAVYDGIKYRKLKIDKADDANLSINIQHGWLAAIQHHFVSALIPPAEANYHYSLQVHGHEYLATAMGPVQTVQPGTTGTFKETVFVGPKLQDQLEQIHPELSRVADYGWLTMLSRPLFWLMQNVHRLFGNWGWTIVFTTLLLKLLFYPLMEMSGKSMGKMRTLGPRIKSIQETYKDDREKLGRATMALHKREKINPAAGCLPVLIQMPVFLAFYWVLLETVEMRQAPFIGWIQDISSRDPFFVLPAIMAGAMFLQYKINPKPTDDVQAKVMMILPLAMSVTFAFFPAGLVLYYAVNTLLGVLQQWNINRRIAGPEAK
jgi:YidC/Oxa1 family membrane protein insertase